MNNFTKKLYDYLCNKKTRFYIMQTKLLGLRRGIKKRIKNIKNK